MKQKYSRDDASAAATKDFSTAAAVSSDSSIEWQRCMMTDDDDSSNHLFQFHNKFKKFDRSIERQRVERGFGTPQNGWSNPDLEVSQIHVSQ